jgi:hypothetical protein
MDTIVAEIVSEGDESVGLFPIVTRVDLCIMSLSSDEAREDVRAGLASLFSDIWAGLGVTVTFSDEKEDN